MVVEDFGAPAGFHDHLVGHARDLLRAWVRVSERGVLIGEKFQGLGRRSRDEHGRQEKDFSQQRRRSLLHPALIHEIALP